MKKIYDISMLIGWLLISIGTGLRSGIPVALIVSGALLIVLMLLDMIILLKGRQ